jgi:hypothetical protein
MPSPVKSVAEPPLIKQSELRRFRQLADERRRLELTYETLRASLIKRLKARRPIQDGKLTAYLARSKQTRFSYEAVAALKGEKFADKLREQIPETVSISVKVEEVD